MTDDKVASDDNKKSKRVRKKRLYATVMSQMEFYFSNSNLTRDKYLRSLIDKDKFIPLSEFLNFEKVKALSATSEDLVHALSNSQFLQLSPDGSAVCRRSPFVPKEDAELCTIYVENIPRASDADALGRTFSAYGTVDYVSLPRHRATGQHRGFAFVEFRTPNMAHNALHAFGALGRRMPSEHYPEYLSAPEPPEPAAGEGELPPETGEQGGAAADSAVAAAGEAEQAGRPGKRKLSTDSGSRDAPMKMTRFAATPESTPTTPPSLEPPSLPAPPTATTSASATPADTENSSFSEWPADGTTSCSEPHREDASLATSLLTERTDDTDLSAGERQGRRRRRTRRGRRAPLKETEDTRMLSLQIMPLSEWSRFREQYRALQKESMAEVKRSLREAAERRPAPAKQTGGTPLEVIPGTVVRFTVQRPPGVPDKHIIATLKRLPGAQYVELIPDSDTAHLRLESAAAAAACLTAAELREPVLLSGDDEANYWRRLLQERQTTRGSRRRSKERGRDRLLRRLGASGALQA